MPLAGRKLHVEARIEILFQDQVQHLDGSRKARKPGCILLRNCNRLECPSNFSETNAQATVLAGFTQSLHYLANRISPFPGCPNDLEGGGNLDCPGCCGFEQRALEFATVCRAIGVNRTLAVRKRRARLLEFKIPGFGFWILSLRVRISPSTG